MGKLKSDRGYTFIEILIVLIIVGILLSVAYPSFKGPIESYRLPTAAKRLAGDIRLINQRSLDGEAGMAIIEFFPDQNYYLIKNEGAVEKQVDLPHGIIFFSMPAFDDGRLYFDALGAPLPSMTGDIVLKNQRGDTYRVSIGAVTGRVSVSSP